jgi:hypothetical protein
VSVSRRTSRLSRVFGALVLAAAPLAAVEACSDPPTLHRTTPPPDATTAETSQPDADRDAAEDTSAPPLDAACQVITEILDAGIDVDQPCHYTLPCGIPPENAFVIRGCGLYRAQADDLGDSSLGCEILESDGCKNDAYAPPANGSFSFQCTDCLGGGGRRPNGLARAPAPRAASALAAYFASLAHDEAASVQAFARMHGELREHGAPRALVAGAARSVTDETRHARVMAREARRRGAIAPRPRVRRQRARSLEAFARENAIEGCVRETYGALLMCWQAQHAAEPELRRVFAKIAADETRHAALSWEVAAWAEPQLDARARARVVAARRRALRTLSETIHARAPRTFDGAIGQPGRAAASALLSGLATSLGLR